MKQKRFFLSENEIPAQWYNIQADMPTKPMPMLNPKTGKPVTPEDLCTLFARELAHQELNSPYFFILLLTLQHNQNNFL